MMQTAEEQHNQWWLVIAAGLAVFMASVDMSIVTAALPVIERDLNISTTTAEWIMLAYFLPLASLALPGARWLDTVGHRPALVFSLAGFAIASLAAGLAPDLGWLIGARLAQGAFGALLFALMPALATAAVRPEARGRAMGLITTLGPLGLISGPVLGGLLVDAPGWPWIFFVNLPVSLVVLLVGLRLLAADLPLRRPDRTWFAEAALLSVAGAALLLALTLTTGQRPAWLLLAGLAVPLLIGWLRLPVSRPVRRLLRTPGVGAPHLALAGAAAAIGVVFFIAPFFLQRALGESAAAAGAILLAFPAGMALAGPVGGFLGDLWGWWRTALLGASLFTVSLLLIAPMDTSWALDDVVWRLFLAGCGNGLFNAPNMAIAMSQAPPGLLATAGATTSLARQVGFAFGPALAMVAWGLSSYRLDGMNAALLLATACSAISVVALLRLGSTPRSRPGSSRLKTPRSSHA
ncbi:MFS transporter [Arthrobacter sp. VKM Ac-2550]|uniref:MFS transporter n=1 Tax=Crystallibacter permensis TaxID=1938888 RepID=UPI0022267501|nr:MFS transporter [Arthrobacter sp. VKM Ac-2550]MCW2131929.1 Major Facilitator Superfamily protein [Arthrobacter sp. VKM Ac-2550]